MEGKKQKAKVVLEVDGERKEFESGTMLLVVNDGEGTFVRTIQCEGGEKFFDLYRSAKRVVEEWEEKEPKLPKMYKDWNALEWVLKELGISLDEEGEADE